MKNKKQAIFNLVIVAFVVMLAIAGIFGGGDVVQAGPLAAPTLVANAVSGDVSPFLTKFQPLTGIAADTNTTGRDVGKFDFMDVMAIVDQATATNTIVISIEYSNDNTNFDTGPAILASSSVDVTEMTRIPVVGKYARIKQDVTNTNTVTVTLTVWLK